MQPEIAEAVSVFKFEPANIQMYSGQVSTSKEEANETSTSAGRDFPGLITTIAPNKAQAHAKGGM